MKKSLILVFAIMISGSAFAKYNWMDEAKATFFTKTEATSNLNARATAGVDTNMTIGSSATNVPSSAAVSNAVALKLNATYVATDTNNVTSLAANTPAGKGAILVGKVHANTNAVWIAAGTTTNDWVRVFPAVGQ